MHVGATLESLAKQEDTDDNMQITIEDRGPKVDAEANLDKENKTDEMCTTGTLNRNCRFQWIHSIRHSRNIYAVELIAGAPFGPEAWARDYTLGRSTPQ